jgi:hypothetical protein
MNVNISNSVNISDLPVVVTGTNANGRVDLMIGDIPAYVWEPNPALLQGGGIVYLNSVDFEKGIWPALVSVTRDGMKYDGFTDDVRIVNLARLIDRSPATSVPLGEIPRPTESGLGDKRGK